MGQSCPQWGEGLANWTYSDNTVRKKHHLAAARNISFPIASECYQRFMVLELFVKELLSRARLKSATGINKPVLGPGLQSKFAH